MESTVTLAEARNAPRALADRVPTWTLLALGALLIVLSGMRGGVASLAWIAPVPFLVALPRLNTWRGRVLMLAIVDVAVVLQVGKIISPPVPAVFALMFGIPLGLSTGLGFLLWDALRRRTSAVAALYAFPALAMVFEWAGYATSELGTWGAAANTQLDDLVLLQLASVVGVAGIGFLMAWVASAVALVLASDRPERFVGHLATLGLVLMGVSAFGTWRLEADQAATVTVAGVVTDVGLTAAGLPTAEELAANDEQLFARSEKAADRGARLVVWNEGATVVQAEDEVGFIARGQALARERDIDLVLAYIVPRSVDPFLFENKYVWIAETGALLETYDKHHPVPSEGSIPGTDPIQVLERPYGRVAGAICYDYDFPSLARDHARQGAGLVVVPASDWAGIDPIHTKMARLRAIEGGMSVLRPVRWASSGAFDGYGRIRGWMPVSEDNDRILVADLPVERIPTLYAVLGDAPVWLAGLYLVVLVGGIVRRRGWRAGSEGSGAG